MPEPPNVADGPHTRSWANRGTHGGDPPSHQTHPWAARQQRDIDRPRDLGRPTGPSRDSARREPDRPPSAPEPRLQPERQRPQPERQRPQSEQERPQPKQERPQPEQERPQPEQDDLEQQRPQVDGDQPLRDYGRRFGRRPEARRGREEAQDAYPTDVFPTDQFDSTQHVTTQLNPAHPREPGQPISFRRAANAGLTSAWQGMPTERVVLPPPDPTDLDTHLLTRAAPHHRDREAPHEAPVHDEVAAHHEVAAHSEPIPDEPPRSEPAHGEPAYDQAAHDQPAYDQPAYEEPSEVSTATQRRQTQHSNRSRPSGKRLAEGLVAMPRVEPVDPGNAILENPEVAEHKRYCWKCAEPVGRSTADTPGVIAGECEKCKAPFNFHPTLVRGEMVAGQYEVQGCLAHGGLGWIYLAVDRNVSDRWVVLKGLQNQLDFEAQVVALAERQFLSEMTHPGIVKIYNFVKHRSSSGVSGGYIVMEYVGGRSLRRVMDLRAPHRLPVVEAVAYMMEVLPALDYLHSFGLAYNDLKPDNVMVTEDEVKLIDLGAVAAMGAYGSIYGTPGYQAPEIAETGPSVSSDIYTVGRTLAAMIMELPHDEEGNWSPGIPGPKDQPLMGRYPTLHRLLQRATNKDPKRRFPSAYAMHCQLAGVLRAILAADTNREHPQVSIEFGSLRGDFGIETLVEQTDGLVDGMHRNPVLEAAKVVTALPVPLINAQDPSAELLSNTLYADPRYALDTLHRTHERLKDGTMETPHSFPVEFALAAARAYLDLGLVMYANQQLEPLQVLEGTDWRVTWYEGVSALLTRRYDEAFELFETVHTMVPGEIAPQLALAATAELRLHDLGHQADAKRWHRAATHHYRALWRTNRAVVSAAFGLARRLAADGKPDEAAAALDQVPHASRHYATARMTTCLLLVSERSEKGITEANLHRAQARLSEVSNDPRANQLQAAVLGAALAWVRSGGRPNERTAKILGCTFNERGLRRGLESRLRSVARIAPDTMHRYRLVDLANYVRPHSRW